MSCSVHSKPGLVHEVCVESHGSAQEGDFPHRSTATGLSRGQMGVWPLWTTRAAQQSCTVSPGPLGAEARRPRFPYNKFPKYDMSCGEEPA